ncbi:MAG: DUF2971 domain-containing protein [Chloroflexi bacterium]|nr:DUF2971 domain-containing protein [Chloroflexota bacterium]
MNIALDQFEALIKRGFYCQIEGRLHPYSDKVKQRAAASLAATRVQLTTWPEENRNRVMPILGDIAAHLLRTYQSQECANRSVEGRERIPDILYKYIPKERIGKGAPNSLRATQLLALNDDMECNVSTMRGKTLDRSHFRALVRSKFKRRLGIKVQEDDLLRRSRRYGDLRLSTFIQKYLNSRVGVVSLSKDLLVPTMWAHYARNTGIVVGYETEALAKLGYEIRSVTYSVLPPSYEPTKDDVIRLLLIDRERMEQNARVGKTGNGYPILCDVYLTEFSGDWRALSRLLFVKGSSWEYEQEVRLLVDLQETRDTGGQDENCWPIRVVDPPPEAIVEVYGGENTKESDCERAAQLARGKDKTGLFVGHVSAHGFRIQKTGGVRY